MFRKYWQHFIRSWEEHFLVQLTTLIVLSGCFTVIIGFFVVSQNLNLVLVNWGEDSKISIFLDPGASEANKKNVTNKIKSSKKFRPAQIISKKQAADNLLDDLQEFVGGGITKSELEDSLPTSIEANFINPSLEKSDFGFLEKFSKELSDIEGVDEVSYGQGWLKSYQKLIYSVSSSTLFFTIVLVLGSILIVGNSIKNSIYQRQNEIKILELIGATKIMIRAPFIFEGFVLGFLSTLAGLIICYVAFNWEVSVLRENFGMVGLGKGLAYLSFWQGMLFLMLGGLIGSVGSYFAIRKLNSGWGDT